MTDMDESAVEATQADRDAAADTLFVVDSDPFVEHIREGFEDDSYLVQAFARHRIAAMPTAERVAKLEEALRKIVIQLRSPPEVIGIAKEALGE